MMLFIAHFCFKYETNQYQINSRTIFNQNKYSVIGGEQLEMEPILNDTNVRFWCPEVNTGGAMAARNTRLQQSWYHEEQ